MGSGLRCVLSVGIGVGLLSLAVGCGDDDSAASAGGGCTTDVECKGARICVKRECVDPDGAPDDGGSGNGNANGSSGAAGRASSTTDGGTATVRAGSGGGTSRGGSGGSTVIDDPELEQACSLDCEARHAADCPMNTGSLDQCLGQCLIIDESSQGYCLDEMTARYACLASGGYTCVSGYPQPQATCIAESTALSTCSQMTPCRAFCDRAQGDCAPAGDACLSACMEQQNGFADAICGIYYTQLLSCWSRDLACENGKPAVGTCGPAVAQVADCVALRNHECDGFCWAAEILGCGADDCVDGCKAKADESSCGHYYERVLDCGIGSRELQLSCTDGVPTVDATVCASEIQQYETCMQGM